MATGKKPPFPVLFGVAGVLFRRSDYNSFDKAFRGLKIRHLGADVPMHEYDLRTHKVPPFNTLDAPRWGALRKDLEDLFGAYDFGIIVIGIHKPQMQREYVPPSEPFPAYHYALENIVERAAMESKRYAKTWRVIAEDRDSGANKDLGREMLRLQWEGCGRGINNPRSNVTAEEVRSKFDPTICFRKKSQNDTGLQVADLAVGPIVRHLFGYEGKERRSVRDVALAKLCRRRDGTIMGFGAKCFPRVLASCPVK